MGTMQQPIIDAQIKDLLEKQKQRLVELESSGTIEVKQFEPNVLKYGGSTVYKYNGKWYNISVYTENDLQTGSYSDTVQPTKYKYWFMNCFGNYVFVKVRDINVAKILVADLTNTKVGHYNLSTIKL
jgi:hypothetical protein